MSGEITKPISDNTLRVLHINWMSWPEFKGGHVVHCSRLIETLSQLNTKQAYLFSGYGSSGEVPRLRKYRKKDEHVDFYQILNATGPVNMPSVDTRNPRIDSIVLDAIKDFSPHLVHIHHMIGFPASTIERIKETFNIPVVITIRDFWYICPLVQLLKVNHEICTDNSKGEGCRDCFRYITGLSPSKTGHRTWSGEFEARKTAWIKALNLADQISAVSSYIKNIYVTEGVSPNKMHVISAGVPSVLKKIDENKIESAKFKIGFLGTISTIKGVNVLLKAFDQWKDPDISLELWGSLSDDNIRLQLEKNDDKRVSVFGPYESDDLTKILSNFDVGIIPSIWPDTAPQVIFEFFSMKIPVVASKIGGIPDFIYHEKNGLLFEPNNVSDLLHALKRLKNDNKLLKRLSKNIKPQKALINYAGEILSVYKKAIKINQEPNGLCVELGGGETPRKKESGFINIDYRISPQVELVANVKDLPIKNGSLEKIYCANLSEHFERSGIQKVLLEWWRVLRPGGWIDVMVPDLEGTLDNWRDIPFNRVLDALYGAQKFEGDYHFNGFTESSLKQVLYRSGFSYSSQVIKWIFDSVPRIQIRAHKKPKISLFPLGDTSIGSSRLRLHRLYPSLVKMGYKVNLFGDVKECDVAIFQKVFDRDLFKKCTGVKILDIDDNYFENGSLVHQCRAAAKSASAIVTSTPELGNIASKYSNASIYTVPTGIDVLQLDNLDIKAPQKVKLIGWVGYPENVVYLEKILPVIRELSIRLMVISRRTEEVDIWLNRNADIVEFREWSILTADGFLKECDMGVAPLSNDGWAQTKSAVKILKYWALGLPVICSPSPEYSRIEAGTGSKFIAHNQKEWKELIQSKKNVRLKQVEQAKNLLSKYSNENLSKKWSEIIQSALYDEYLKRENIKGEETNNSKVNIEDKKVQIISHRKNPDKNNGEIYSKDRILEKKSVVRYSVHENTELKPCSIIIPVFNQLEYTKQCIESLYKYTPQSLYELIIVDNNSTDGTDKYLNTLNGNIQIIKNVKNRGFSIACNQGANIATGEYVLFLNNDTEVLPNWLESLISIIKKDQSVAAVGSKLLFSDRTIQHAGVVVINNKKLSDPLNAIHIYYGQKEDFKEANKPRCYQVLTGACLLIRRKYFESVNGFDEQYWNGYEDVDLCFKLQEKGWKLIYQPESVVIHHESKSGMERFSKTQQNIDLLNQKWRGKIKPDLIIEKDGKIKATKANRVQEYEIKTQKHDKEHGKEKNIKVSIIILTLNQIKYTRKCIESINRHTDIPYEIIVIDNGSTDETLEYLYSLKKNNKHQKELTIIENKKNLGFAGGNNVGLGLSKGEYVLMMNNDIVVTPGWMDRLIDSAKESPKIGIVGPMSNQVSGPQYVANVQYNQETLEGLNRFSEKFNNDNYGKSQRTLRVVGFCMLVKLAVINKIGGMDDRFGLGNFEDDDFSIRAALAGFESWTVEDCFVHHFGSRTFIGEKIDYNESLYKNWEIFKGKWGLPSNLEYGSSYSLSQMTIKGFDPRIHYIPLPTNGDDSITNRIEQFSGVEQEYRKIISGIDKEDLESAIDRLQGFVRKYNDFAIAYNDLGVFFYQNGEKENALKSYQKAVSLDTQNITLQKNLADFLYVECGKVEEALKIYINILSTNPEDVETLLITGHICVALEQFEDAASFYEKVIEIEPSNSNACQHLEILKQKFFAPPNSSLVVAATDAPALENNCTSHAFPTDMTGENSTEHVQVSIIMLLEGPHDAMQKSYASVRGNTKVRYELFFIENGAGQKVRKWIQKTVNNDKYQRSVYLEHRGSIAEKLYHAVELACGEHIVIIRGNILVSEHWLTDMLDTLHLSKNAGIVGLFSTRNSGTSLLSAPINEKDYREYAREFRARNRHRRIPVQLIDSSCMIFQRKLANAIRNGDTQFTGIEALVKDLCQRISEAGYQNMVAGDVIVHNLNYGAKMIGVTDKKKNGGRNQKLFHKKWNGLMTDYSHVGQIKVQTLLEKADRLFQNGHVEEGIDIFLEGISRFPEDDRVYVTLAEQLINYGRHQDALDALIEIPVDAKKGNKSREFQTGKIRLLKAYSQEGLGNYEAAAELVDQILSLQSDNPKALNLKGILAYRKNEKNRAIEYFKRAIDVDLGYGEPHTNIGSILWESNDMHDALNHFERGFILNPKDIDIANAYHESISALKEFDRAELIVREAFESYPNNRKIQYMLIDVLIQGGNLNEALSQIENTISTCGLEDGVLDAAIKIREQIGPVGIRKKTKKKSSVSLCMIVKNEEEFLPQCLASMKPIVDEMIIVDTGSTDRTKDIATVHGAQVFDFNWNDDFASARNFSIAKASGDWILIMDADEVISPMDYTAFRRLINQKPSGPSAYSIVTRNYCHKANNIGWNPNDGYYAQEEDGIGWLPSEKVRLFSNNSGIKFEGAVHEMAESILKRKGIKIKKSKIPVHHYGRLNTDKLGQKGQTYYEIGSKKLVEDGGDISAVRELAIQATILEKNLEAIELWEKFLSMKPDHGVVPEAFVNMGTAYIRLKDYRNALLSAQKAVALCPEMKEAQYNLGMAELYNGNADAAVNTLKRLLDRYPDFPPAQFLLAASKCCEKETTNRNGDLKKLKQSSFGPALIHSVAELAEGLMTANQHKMVFKLLKNAIEDEIVSNDIMHLYFDCIKINKDSNGLSSVISDEADVLINPAAELN